MDKDISIFKVAGIKNNIFKYLYEIFKFYKSNVYDIVYLNECTAEFFVYVFPILFNKKTKLIIHSHNGSGKNLFLHKFLCFFQNVRVDSKYACSDVAADWMFGKSEDVKIIQNAVNLEEYKYNEQRRAHIRKSLNIGDDVTVVGSIARFDIQKNHKKIIDVFNEYIFIFSLYFSDDNISTFLLEQFKQSTSTKSSYVFL